MVTGAAGFVGRHLCPWLAGRGFRVVESRRAELPLERASPSALEQALDGADAVVHLAARVHVMRDAAHDPLAEYRRVNTEATLRLAEAAARRGVARFVFLSTIKVNGERTTSAPFRVSDAAAPADPYATSKWEAERGLASIKGLDVVVLRPPLVYGPGVKGNFLRLLRLVRAGVPLPLASVANARSMIYAGNLASAVERALSVSAQGTFLVSDGEDLSSPELVRRLAAAMGRPARLFACQPRLLSAIGRVLGKGDEVMRMLESLRVDCSETKQRLQWSIPFTAEHGLKETADWFAQAGSAA
ncbi:MAG: NAD-dependent epimerase/dehydratase family protein [Betaproteobacteria bacterium]